MKIKIIILITILSISIYADIRKEYYPNGDIKRETEFTNDKKNGKSKFYFQNNYLFAMAEYKMGVRDGVYVEYDINGNITLKDVFVKGQQIGQRLFYRDGKLLNGTFKTNTPHGENIETYKNGHKLGLQVKCDIDSCVKQVYKEDGLHSYTTLVGDIIQQTSHYKNNILNGAYLKYNLRGILYKKGNYKDGKKDGIETEFYTNGNIKSQTSFKNGLVTKDTITYNEDGSIKVMKNPYNGVYTYDTSQIKNTHILDDIARAKTLDADPFVLKINESTISIFGYQTGQPIRQRWYSACLLENGNLNAVNHINYQDDYCDNINKDSLILKFRKDSENNKKLICENCEKNGFPSVWIR